MDNTMAQISRRKAALTAGCLLMALAVLAGVGYGYAFNGFYKAGDMPGTISNFNSVGDAMLKLTIASFSIILIVDIIIAWALYEFFKNQVEEKKSQAVLMKAENA